MRVLVDPDKSGLFSKMFCHVRAYTAVTRGEKDEPDRCRLNPQDMSSVMELTKE